MRTFKKMLFVIGIISIFGTSLLAVSQELSAQGKKNLRSANIHLGGERYEKAMPLYEEVLAENPNQIDALNNLAAIYYDHNNRRTGSELYVKSVLTEDRYQITTGGLFLIEKKLWDLIGGMDVRFRTGEDLDLGLRLARKGHLLLRKKELFAIHHTQPYKSKSRMWQDLFAGKTLYARGVLYRKHILLLNRHIFKRMIKSDPTFLLLILCSILTILTKQPYILFAYLIGIMAGIFIFRKIHSLSESISRILYQFVRDLFTTSSLLFFYPRRADLQYERVK